MREGFGGCQENDGVSVKFGYSNSIAINWKIQ